MSRGGSFRTVAQEAGIQITDYMRTIWRATRRGEDVAAMRVLSVLDPGDAQRVTLTASLETANSQDDRDRLLARSFQAVTSGRADADELRAAFALGGWVAVRDLLEAQGTAHARADSP